MNTIFSATLSMTVIGAVCAFLLSVASKVMAVSVDERVEQIKDCLPGSNCGACGYPGCSGYAEALVSSADVKKNLCAAGGSTVVKFLSELLGGEEVDAANKTAVVRCRGECGAQQQKAEYKGIETCAAASALFGGSAACAFGCIGFGDCQIACPHGAICIENGLARINPARCTGCGLCAKVCPRKLITAEESDIAVAVLCRNVEKGAAARKKCASACIGCGKCARECPEGAIAVKDNLARIDYDKCTGCGHCADVCVTQAIRPRAGARVRVAP